MKLLKKYSSRHMVAATVALIAAGAVAASEVQATEGYFQNGVGARHKGMAGAGVANTNDATAITLNPAGLVHAGRQLNGSVSAFLPFRELDATTPLGFPFEITKGGKTKSDSNIFAVPNIAYSHPISENTVLGFSLSGNGGMNTDYADTINTACVVPGATGIFCGGPAGVDLNQVYISGAFAHKINKYVSVGIAPVLAIQRIRFKGLGFFAGIPGFTTTPSSLRNPGYSYSVGAGVRLGLEVSPTDDLRIAASYQSRTFMSKFKKYKGLFAQGGDFDIPMSAQIGVAYDFTPDLTGMLDFRYIAYKSVRSIANFQTATAPLGASNGSGFGWKNMKVIKVGLEYKANDALTVRGGYSYNNNPIRKSQVFFNIFAPAVSQHHITAGATYKFSENSDLEFAAMFSPNAKKTGVIGPAGQTATISMYQLEFTAGYNYHW